jgi:hypothetical protein
LDDLIEIRLVEQPMFPDKQLIDILVRQAHEFHENRDRELEREFAHEFAFASIPELGDITAGIFTNFGIKRLHPLRRE